MLPARWVGHRRWTQKLHKSKEYMDMGGTYREGLTWTSNKAGTPKSRWQIIVSEPMGAVRAKAKAQSQRRMVAGSFPRGRNWRFTARAGQYWGQFVEDAGRVMNLDPMLFEVYYGGELVNQNVQMPREVQRVDFVWIGPEEVHSSPDHRRDHSRSRRRRRSSERSRSDSSEIEPETIYLEYQQGDGVWALPIHLQDFNVRTWEHVNGAMIEAALIHLYPGVFLCSNRIAIAADGEMLRPTDVVGVHMSSNAQMMVVGHGIGAALPTVSHLLWRRRVPPQQPENRREDGGYVLGLPLLTEAFEALRLETPTADEDTWLPLRTTPSAIRVAVAGRGAPRLLQVHMRPNNFTVSQLEAFMRREYDDVFGTARLMIARRSGYVLTPDTQITVNAEQVFWAVVMDPLGGNLNEPDLSTTVKEVLPHVQGRLRGNQIKLLLRGEQGLLSRVHKARFDKDKQVGMLLDAAARYDMHVSNKRDGVKLTAPKEAEWHTVQRKQAKTPKVLSPESPGSGVASKRKRPQATTAADEKEKKYTLKANQWSQQILEEFVLDMPGVILAPSQDRAEKWAQQLVGTKQAVAIITVQPLQAAKTVEKATIQIVEHEAGKVDKEKVVTACICSFGPVSVQYKGQIGEVVRKSTPTTTVVLRARTQAQVVTAEEWKQCRQLNTPVALKKYFKDSFPQLHVEDIFRVEVGAQELSFLVRVHSLQQQQWLAAQDIPFSFAPTGDSIQQFRVVWDRETSTLKGLQKKYSHIQGYSGPVLSSKGIGARFQEASYQAARQKAGLAIGTVYLITGLPIENTEQDTVELMKECQWEVTPLSGSRRVKGRMAQVRVRAQSPPPTSVLKVTSGREISTVYIQEAAVAPPQQRRPEPDTPSRTRAEALRSTLGREKDEVKKEASSAQPFTHTPQWTPPRKRAQWADQRDDRDSDQDMQQSDSEESFEPGTYLRKHRLRMWTSMMTSTSKVRLRGNGPGKRAGREMRRRKGRD